MSDIIDLGKFKPKSTKKEKITWRLTDSTGNVFLAQGTSLTMEEDCTTSYVYDENICIFILTDAVRAEIHNDPRLQTITTAPAVEDKPAKTTKAKKPKATRSKA